MTGAEVHHIYPTGAHFSWSTSSGSAPANVVVSVDTTGLTYGLYEGTLTFTATFTARVRGTEQKIYLSVLHQQ